MPFKFIENKGQVINQNKRPNSKVLFLVSNPAVNIQLRDGGFSYDSYILNHKGYQFSKARSAIGIKNQLSSIFEFHRIDLDFLGLNQNYEILTYDSSDDYLNYYTTGTPLEGITFVHSYQKIIYKNIYPNIDVEFIMDDKNGFKYNIVIYPGGVIEDIQIRISGATCEVSKDGSALLNNNFSQIIEKILSSFYYQGDKKVNVTTKFHNIKKNILGLSVMENVPNSTILFIDPVPERLWSTYYGGNDQDIGGYCTVDLLGNVYLCGETSSANNIATEGSHQSTIGSNNGDAFLAKFDFAGQRQWATYYGGDNSDAGHCCIANANSIYLVGQTASSNNISTPGSHQPSLFGSSFDGFIARFNIDGIRLWGSYYGGLNVDEIYSITIDDSSFLYFCGNTQSPSNIATPGSHQSTIGGMYDGFLVKFDSTGQRIWGTYYGGTSQDYCYSVASFESDKIYLGGETWSINNISTPGSFQPTLSGLDAFLVRFNNNGERIWGTYFGGTGNESGKSVATDTAGLVLLAGRTNSPSGLTTSGSFQSVYGGGSNDGFLSYFNDNGQRLMCTYYGGSSTDYINACTVSSNGSTYFTGRTGSTNNIASTNVFQDTLYADLDAFLVKFDYITGRQWGTYFGAESFEEGKSISVFIDDTIPNIYIAGQTSSTSNLSTLGSQQYTYGGGLYDTFLALFKDCEIPDSAGTITGLDTVCIPALSVSYTVQAIPTATTYLWSLPSGAIITSGQNTPSITIDFGIGSISGYISVHGINSCGEGDSAYLYVVVNPRPIPTIIGCDTICEGLSCTYYTDSGRSQYQWDLSTDGTVIAGGTQTDTSVAIQWNFFGNQWLSVNYTDTNGCEAISPSIFNVEVTPGDSISVDISSSIDSICEGSSVTFTAQTLNTGTNPLFQWFINGVDTNHNDSILTYIPTQSDTVFCIITSFEPCRSNNPDISNTQIINVLPILPVSINISASENPVCIHDSVTYTGVAMNGGLNPGYQWHINGNPIGTNVSNYSNVPSNGDQVYCLLTSTEQCTTNNPATSDTITMIVNPLLPVGITISASTNPVCEGSLVTFTSISTNGGSSPNYQWQVNGINTGTNSPNFTYNPVNGGLVSCTLTSNAECVTNNPATSNTINMSVGESPYVNFAICFDTITTLNAKPFKLKGGIPLGGTYSGNGTSWTSETGWTFNPSNAGTGIHSVTYSFTNLFNCSNNATRTISVVNPALLTCGDSLTDIRDNKKYPTVQIGSQCWLAMNLNHGQQIGGSSAQMDNCMVEKYCYNDIQANCTQYGALYQWDELMCYEDAEEIQGLCPPGWHVPSEADWNQLFAVYQGNAFAGSPLRYTGYSGFNVLLAGVEFFNQNHRFADFASIMWSSTSHGPYKAWSHGLNEYNYSVSYYPSYRSNAFSVRCVRD